MQLEKPEQSETPAPSTMPDTAELEAALQHALTAPGVAPWLLGRAGLPNQNEVSLAYSGRHLRIGFRHSFDLGHWALSVGAGASSVHYSSGKPVSADEAGARSASDGSPISRWNALGWGVDVPVSVGWQSRAEVVALWTGLRAGLERIRGEIPHASYPRAAEADGTRWSGTGFVGFSVGVHPIRARAELSATFASASGALRLPGATDRPLRAQGLSLTPAGALAVQF